MKRNEGKIKKKEKKKKTKEKIFKNERKENEEKEKGERAMTSLSYDIRVKKDKISKKYMENRKTAECDSQYVWAHDPPSKSLFFIFFLTTSIYEFASSWPPLRFSII